MNADEIRLIAHRAESSCEFNPLAGVEDIPRDEKSWSRVFASWLAGKACFVPEEKGWRFFDGKHWIKDGDSQRINRLCKVFIDELMVYAQMSDNVAENTRRDFITFLNRYNKYRERRTLIEDAKCEVSVQRSEFDALTNCINLQNGSLNLDTFTFTSGHNPGDLFGKIANVAYDPNATCDEWVRFLDQSLIGDKETIEFLQVVLGLALTCDVSAECMFILLGKTRSGKSTTVDTIQKMLNQDDDGYACSCSPESFAVRRFNDASKPSSDIARLAGKRFVVTSEPQKNMLFDIAKIKLLTGGEPITARFLHENDFQFYPQFTLVMTANHAPKVNDMTLFESDRVHVIPFNNHLEANERDLKLKQRLAGKDSLSGIFNWCLDGLRRFREEGLNPSRMSVLATESYKADSDKLLNFQRDCLVPANDGCITGKECFDAYRDWCRDSGYEAGGKQTFFSDLRERNLLVSSYTVAGVTKRNVVLGFRLSDSCI